MNKTFADLPLSFRLKNHAGVVRVLGDSLNLKSQEATSAKLFVLLNRDQISSMNTPLEVEVYSGNQLTNTLRTSFLGPVKRKSE